MRFRHFCILAAVLGVLTLPVLAQAQSSRLYFAGYMGLNMNMDSTFKESTTLRQGDFGYDNAISYAGALGLRLSENWRVEGEISYRKTDFDKVTFNGAGTVNMGGSLGTWLYMLNAYYDFDYEWKRIQPYVSAGLGVAYHTGKMLQPSGLAPNASDSAFGIAWQAGGGLKYRVNDSMALTGGYRYLGTTDAAFGSYDFDYGSHEWRVGLEWDIPVDMFK